MRDSVRAWGPVAAWVGVILVATAVPFPTTLRGPDLHLDKVGHALLYGGLGWLVARALRLTGRGDLRALSSGFVACVLFAAADELLQAWVPGRVPTAGDWLADVVGLAAGLLASAARSAGAGGGGNGSEGEAYRSQDEGAGEQDRSPATRPGDPPAPRDDPSPDTRKDRPHG